MLSRRSFLHTGAAVAGGSLVSSALPVGAVVPGQGRYLFAVIADSHVIDRFYVPGSENGFEDNDSILRANERLVQVRDTINAIQLTDGRRVEQVFLVGDCFHNYPSADLDFYEANHTRIDVCREILAGFKAPVHLGFGNHDYDVPRVSREMSHELFAAKLQSKPYSRVDVGGIRFLHLNNFLGASWDSLSPAFNKGVGSLGEAQLQWAEAELAARKPTVVFVHYPLWIVMPTEVRDFGLHPLLRRYQSHVLTVISGHWHKWVDFAQTYGPQHTVAASTRYDPHAFMLFEADGQAGTVRWLDRSRPEWSTHFAVPYRV